MSLLKMSLSGTVMIGAIAVLRALLLHKLPKSAFLALWGVAAARLLIPFSFRSALSVYSLLGRLAAAGEAAANRPVASLAGIAPAQSAMPAPDAAALPAADAAMPWGIVWGMGALLCAGFFAAAYLKCLREFRASLPVEDEHARAWLREHRLRRPLEIRQSGRVSAPLTYGVFRPVILMPKTTDWDDGDALQYVLAHELVHVRRFDAVTKLALTGALCVHWFNPAVWIMVALANRDIELSCDEAVIRQFGERTKSAYAMTLIRMEEARSGLNPLGSHFSRNAIEERIVAMMKIKKTSLAALLAAIALVGGVTTAFATSAEEGESAPRGAGDATDTAIETSEVLSIVDSKDGKVKYSFDGGETFETLTEEELKARFPSADVEWWTADEYEAWLENEKVELQNVIGERAWTSSRGEFVWTQEIVDETIAMYEGILENIQNGMLYSKTIDGVDALGMLSSGSAAEGTEVFEGEATASDFSEYEPFGLSWDEDEEALLYHGERVRYFLDGVELDGAGGVAVRLEYLDAELEGEIDVHTVRRRVQNPDGSFDPMGPLTGLEAYSQAEFEMRTLLTDAPAETAVSENPAEITSVAEGNADGPGVTYAERFEKYAAFGIAYVESEENGGTGNVYYKGQLVGRFIDVTPSGGAFTFSSAKRKGLAVKTVYDQDGRLTGIEVAGDGYGTEQE